MGTFKQRTFFIIHPLWRKLIWPYSCFSPYFYCRLLIWCQSSEKPLWNFLVCYSPFFGRTLHCMITLCLSMGIRHSTCFLQIAEWYAVTSLCSSPSDDHDVLYGALTALHPPFRFCHWIILLPTFFCLPFPGEASHTYFFRRKVSASRILQVPDALFLEFFQKLFAVCASQ